MDLVRLLAFLGVEEAREITPIDPAWGYLVGLKEWLREVSRLAAKLPPRRLEVDCSDLKCEGNGWYWGDPAKSLDQRHACEPCKGTGKVTSDTPAETWRLVVAAEATGRTCWNHGTMTLPTEQELDQSIRRERALDACAAWIEEPTKERAAAWAFLPLWVPGPPWPSWPAARGRAAQILQAAAKILGEPRTREVAAAAVLGRLL
jgi:hypothetical protein